MPAKRARPGRPSPWLAAGWGAVVWLGLASAVWKQNAPGGAAPALAFAFGTGGDALSLAPAHSEGVPPLQPVPPLPSVSEGDVCAQLEPWLTRRDAKWKFLTSELRAHVDAAAQHSGPWGKVLVSPSYDPAGGVADWAWRQQTVRDVSVTDSAAASAPHFLIGNGSRSGDGEIEATSQPLPPAGGAVRIRLVGDARLMPPTPAQCRALTELVDYLRAKAGMIPVVAEPAPQWPLPAVERAYNATLPAWAGPPDHLGTADRQ